MEAECQAAAQELLDGARDHAGVISYMWAADENGALIGIEVQESEESMLNHIALNDFSRMAAASTVSDIVLIGPEPSQKVRDVLAMFGDYKVYVSG
jgi:quinol monooxygenase YgiN